MPKKVVKKKVTKKKVTHPAAFNKLLSEFGSRCAWVEKGEYHFTLSGGSMSDEAQEEQGVLQEKYDGFKLNFWIGYGDDCPNAVSFKDKALFSDKLVMEYLNSYIGRSCYDE